MFTRQQYMNHECTHEQFYGQFVTAFILELVERNIGKGAICASRDPHFNDIALARWDTLRLQEYPGVRSKLSRANGTGGVSIADGVCIVKEAARRIKAGATVQS